MNPIPEQNDSSYVLGRTNEEYERLRRQAELWEPATKSVLHRVGLMTGMSCLDVGCGPGEVMRLMGELVGPDGRVVGLDIDEVLGQQSLSFLVNRGLRQCTFIAGDVRTLDYVPGEPFDIVFTRFLLHHLDDPIAALRKMYQWLKPGGTLTVQEYYFDSLNSYPPFEPVSEFKNVFFGTYGRAGKDTSVAAKLPQYFIEAGIGVPDNTDVSGHFLPMRVSASMLSAVYRSVLPLALEFGVTTEERSAQFFENIGKTEDGSYLLWPLLFSIWKQKR
ncbi:MAG: class I SAM-dependent methyltransferase [Acidobacteriaceae bacterium]|nr:class I SAM-dependent methyltransferase [Acidobacteriaceae bacterium]